VPGGVRFCHRETSWSASEPPGRRSPLVRAAVPELD